MNSWFNDSPRFHWLHSTETKDFLKWHIKRPIITFAEYKKGSHYEISATGERKSKTAEQEKFTRRRICLCTVLISMSDRNWGIWRAFKLWIGRGSQREFWKEYTWASRNQERFSARTRLQMISMGSTHDDGFHFYVLFCFTGKFHSDLKKWFHDWNTCDFNYISDFIDLTCDTESISSGRYTMASGFFSSSLVLESISRRISLCNGIHREIIFNIPR